MHLSELLRDREGIEIGRTTLRRILVRAGLNSHRRRPPKHRVRRQRMAREGMLIQIDGSYHRWLGEDGPQFTLLLAVDDATGRVVNALFCEYENTRSYLLLMRDSDTELRHTARTLFRPPWRLQAHAAVRDRLGSHPVLPRDGRAWRTADIRTISASQRPGGTHRGHAPGPAGHGAETCMCSDHRRRQPCA